MLMMATSGDKALSLVRPLDYNEIVTFTSVNAYILFSILLGIILGVVLPLTTLNISHSDLFILLPLGLCRQSEMHMAILVFFTVPCGLFVTLCHIYVYMVANRHANAIKRDSYVRERMMTSASYKMTTTSFEQPQPPKVVIGMEPIVNKNSNYLTIPIANNGTTLNHQSTSSKPSKAIEKGFASNVGGRKDSNDSSHAKSRPNRYGASLLLVVLVVFASRMPSEVWPFLQPLKENLTLHQFFYLLANIPLFLCSAANPWIYAYHNLDLKPAMQRLLKRACRGVIRPSQRRRSKSNQTSIGHRSYLANWQISVFATYSHGLHHSTRPRRSSWHQEAVSLNQQQTVQASPTTSAGQHFRSNSQCHRHHRRKSFGTIAAAVRKTRRSKSCTHRAIPTVTVWDGDSVRLTRPEDML